MGWEERKRERERERENWEVGQMISRKKRARDNKKSK